MSVSDKLDPDLLSQGCQAHEIGQKVLVFDSTSSTNDMAGEYSRNPQNHGLVVFAEQQQQGRGRSGHSWVSRHGQSLLCSIVLIRPKFKAECLSLASAVAVAEAIGPMARIKWPNDILIGARKVCGILLESRQWPSHQAFILGLGINCHQAREDFPQAIRPIATSLDMVSKTRTDRTRLARRVFSSLDLWLRLASHNVNDVVAAWEKSCMLVGQRLSITYKNRPYHGHCIGVDPQQGLILQLDQGVVRMFDAAHSSITKPLV
ncbi:MAG: biotin--[acetyl-CoA-carboxylase] ligase [Planctomycetes bacterium]|nr:biotin--[acetyl-CoA-carboxylase] ligase [Planctomycetota bacterium]